MTHINIIVSIPPKVAPLYARVGQPLSGSLDGLVMLEGDRIDYVGQFVRLQLLKPEAMKGVWVAIPTAAVVLLVSGDKPSALGFANA